LYFAFQLLTKLIAMRKKLAVLSIVMLCILYNGNLNAQGITISGNVREENSKVAVPSTSVLVKGTNAGTFTDNKGNFKITTTQKLPLVLVFSSIGFETQEITVTDAANPIQIDFKPASILGTAVVVSATRSVIRSLESPVSIERIGSSEIKNLPAPSFYDAITNLKGVDAVTSSIMFKSMGTRGFNGSGNVRMNQIVDGMDNQAPGLNFSVGNIIGLTELDVDNVELLPGASSALYGSGGMTGTILMTSKDPFNYQGLSAQYKMGVNHVGDANTSAAPYYDIIARYGQAFNNKFAFKIAGEYTQAKDWMATDYRNYSLQQAQAIPGDRSLPDYNGINTYGDESAYFNVQQQVFNLAKFYNSIGDTATANKLNLLGALTPKNSGVSRTGYAEKDLTNYKAYNFKIYGGVYYKINNSTTASIIANYGRASTVYQGTDRYSLKDVAIGQYKAEVAGKHFYVRAYTTQEDAGSSYAMGVTSTIMNEGWAPTATVWAPTYIATYIPAYAAALAQNPGTAYAVASAAARSQADANRPVPGSPAFNHLLDSVRGLAIPHGGKFNDQTNLYVGEAMYNFSNQINWADITLGVSTKEYVLNSHGTIFADTAGRININETGAFLQLQKGFFDDVLKITLAGRYDKNSNFKGRFTPRITAVYRIAPDNYIRASFQTAYRFPSTQNQYIDLQTATARLIGGLPQFFNAYGLAGTSYDTATINRFLGGTGPLTPYQYKEFKPESVASYELGYKSLINKKLLIDLFGYYAQYTDFIGLTILVKNPLGGANAGNTYGLPTNSSNKVNTVGAGLGIEYSLPGGFIAGGNVVYNDFTSTDKTVQTDFNTPKVKFNLSFANYTIKKILGFNITYRWQQSYLYESTFITGNTPAFGALDAQVSVKMPNLSNSMIKIGATNLLNKYYNDAIGNASVGGLYYISFGYHIY
jgi:outer membrane receptor protein involved in Fe transport